MSFNQELKDYLLQSQEVDENVVYGILDSVNLLEGELGYTFKLSNDNLSKKLIEFIGKHKGSLLELIKSDGLSHTFFINEKIVNSDRNCFDEQNEKKVKSYIRGIFLGRGNIMNPEIAYHLELYFKNFYIMSKVQGILQRYQINHTLGRKSNSFYCYMKNGENIKDFLVFIGGIKYVFLIEDLMVLKEIKNNANRINNCDVANIDKIAKAASLQIEAIKYIEKYYSLKSLNKELEEIAVLRLKYPEFSLKELGAMVSEPIGKAAVNYRLKKIINIYNDKRKEY